MGTEWDDMLRYECAIEMCRSLMAQCTAIESAASRANDVIVQQDMTSLRQAYLTELRMLDPANTAAIDAKIQQWGTTLARKIEAPREEIPQQIGRLAGDQHTKIFQRSILTETLSNLRSNTKPVAVIITGEPGTGKTTTLRNTVATWASTTPAVIDPDLYLAYHPHSWSLILAHDPDAAEAVHADVLDWTALAASAVIATHSDVALEIASTPTNHASELATLFRDVGYRVELETTVLPEPERKLHLSIREQCRHGNWTEFHGRL